MHVNAQHRYGTGCARGRCSRLRKHHILLRSYDKKTSWGSPQGLRMTWTKLRQLRPQGLRMTRVEPQMKLRLLL